MDTTYSTNRKVKRMFVNILSIFVILVIAFSVTTIAYTAPKSPFLGKWQAINVDGSNMGLSIAGRPTGPFHITWTDKYISFCNGEAGIIRGTGWLNESDSNLLEADLHLECFTTEASLDFHLTFRYHPGTNMLSIKYDLGQVIIWHRPGRPQTPPPALNLRVNYGHDWAESFYEAGHTAWVTVTDSDGNVKAMAELVTESKDDWGGETGFQTNDAIWFDADGNPMENSPDIQPNDWVYGWVDNGASAQVQIGDISGMIDFVADSIEGTIYAPWFSSEVNVECFPWGAPEPQPDMKFDTIQPNGMDPYSCSWGGEWNIQPGQDVGVGYFGPDGHWVANAFRKGETIIVTSIADSGTGTLRQALLDAQSGYTITFDPAVFPPDAPETITVISGLPQIHQGNLTIDASDAGVILDGSQLPRDTWIPGLEMVSDGNTIRGLQVINFTGTGLVAAFHGRNNTIGGDRTIGAGPIGQGNLTSGNDYGIGIWDFASNNIVTGNIVGTDVRGTSDLGNQYAGIWVTGGGIKNVIGPDNIIVYNDRCGIEVFDSLGNTLTQNSIHDNGGFGICLGGGGNTGLSAPFIVGFDLTSGLISGTTCANCTVEIFSDSGDEGAAYEGQVGADSSGVFTINKGTAFTNPHITLTATDPDGNTSQFSRPIGRDIRVIVLQEGNSLPKSQLLTMPSSELADNRIGIKTGDLWLGGSDSTLDETTDLGGKRVHTSLYEREPPIDWSTSEYDIPPEFDQFIDDLAENGVAVNYKLHFWDKAGHANGEELSTPRFQTPEQVQDFLDYVRFVVGHFRGRIQYYSIWSEPDNCGEGGGIKCILPEDYIELAKQVIPVIREEDPEAKVVSAPNVLFFAREDLFTLLKSDVVKQFDVISWHPIYDVVPNHLFYGNFYYEYPLIIQEIKQTASAHGFTGEFWGTELTWNSREVCSKSPLCWDYLASDQRAQGMIETDLQAAKYYARGIVMQLGLDVGVGINGFGSDRRPYPTVRNLNTVMAGNKPLEIPVEIESDATNITSYGFILPNGDRLFALWTDGVAVDDDPGVNATLTFPGLSTQKVVGIDVLHGLEQELVTETENGDLIIRDLLVKDYPIILRITASTSTVTPRPIPAEPVDVIFYNGTIITIEESQPLAEAIALRNGLIQAVGTNEEILALQGADTAVVNLEGKTMMPGFVDPHTHILAELSLEDAQQLALENGITTLTEMNSSPEFAKKIQAFASEGKLRVRTSLYLRYVDACGKIQGDWYLKYHPTREFGEMLRIGGVKLFADGGEQSCGGVAYSFDPPGGQGRGTLWFTQDQLNQMVTKIQANGYQAAIHAQGDVAIEQAQNTIAFALNGEPNTMRHRIEHNAILRPDLLPRYGEIGIVTIIFGTANTCREVNEGRMTKRFGQEHLAWLENWRALMDANPGAHIAWHGDYPWVQPVSPLMHLYSLVTRKQVDENGNVCNPPQWLADHALTVEEALRMMTFEGAYALFREQEVGSLAPGKLADVIVLSGDPLSNPDGIKDLSVLVTMVSGKTEYCAAGWEALCP